MNAPPSPEKLDPQTAQARKLPVHTEVEHDDEGELHVHGWVTCPARGQLDLDRCTACMHCRGVLLEPRTNATDVLCSRAAARETRAQAGDVAGAWADRPALAVTPEVPIRELGELMIEYSAELLLVVAPDGAPLGTVAQRDVLRAMLGGRGERGALEVMRPLSSKIHEGTPMPEVVELMSDQGASILPVADASGHVFAMLTQNDVLRWSTQGRTG